MKVTITGWKEGFNKIQFNRFLRKELGYTIASSKGVVDKILDQESVTLNFENSDDVTEALSVFCLEFEVLDSKQ